VTLNPNFSIHTWILWRGETAKDQTIFSKDRFGSSSQKFLHAYISKTTSNLVFEFTSEENDAYAATGGTTLTADTWYYVVFSVELLDSRIDSDVKIFLNNNATPEATTSSSGDTDKFLFAVDNISYNMFLAASRSAEDTIEKVFKGFFYQFAVSQASHLTSVKTYASTCLSGCLTFSCEEYADGSVCSEDGSCTDLTCRRSDPCDSTGCLDGF
jgi:hypothetical protein